MLLQRTPSTRGHRGEGCCELHANQWVAFMQSCLLIARVCVAYVWSVLFLQALFICFFGPCKNGCFWLTYPRIWNWETLLGLDVSFLATGNHILFLPLPVLPTSVNIRLSCVRFATKSGSSSFPPRLKHEHFTADPACLRVSLPLLPRIPNGFGPWIWAREILRMGRTLHQLVGGLSQYSFGFIPRVFPLPPEITPSLFPDETWSCWFILAFCNFIQGVIPGWNRKIPRWVWVKNP